MNTVVIIQARVESTRLPGKVLLSFGEHTVIETIVKRVEMASTVDKIVVAVPSNISNKRLRELLANRGIDCFPGSRDDVLSRYASAAEDTGASTVVRVTADCPLIDPVIIDKVVNHFFEHNLEYARTSEAWPDGLDVEVFSIDALRSANKTATARFDREHVTPFIARSVGEALSQVDPPSPLGNLRLTLDYPEDFSLISAVFRHFQRLDFNLQELFGFATANPELFDMNSMYSRNEGATMRTGEKLYSRAKSIIPGGTMLLSKRPEMHAPKGWPAYFDRTDGCFVWDLDGEKFTDVSWMGIGTNILGYSNSRVDAAVKEIINKGNLSTLNAPEEVELAENLCEIHEWAEMVRFTRSGGEAGAVAVRIGRAASGKDHVAFCGYHGWHDWYLAANLGNQSALDGHLLPGLNPAGVPRALVGTATPFRFNDLESVTKVVTDNSSGVIYMEVERSEPPTIEFLQGVRDLADSVGAVLVFDECTSGFRSVLGGQHLKYGVNPDLAIFGKTLGNGYAINAVIGSRKVMDHAQDSFVSSTFWTERIGPAAGVATLKEMRVSNAPAEINEIGVSLQNSLRKIGADLDLDLKTWGIPALTFFSVEGASTQELRTLVTREMLKRNFLGSNAIYVSIAHTPEIIDAYLSILADILGEYSAAIRGGSLADELPEGLVSSGFARLT